MLIKSKAMKAGIVMTRVTARAFRPPRMEFGGFFRSALHSVLNLKNRFLSCLEPEPGNMARLLSASSIVLIVTGCSNDVVPVNATLSISPETHSTNIVERHTEEGRCVFDFNNHVDIPIIMQLNTADGSPIGDTTLNVYADFAENTYTGLPVLKLYDDLNSNGVVDAENELVSGADDSIARVRTDKWTGSRALLLRVNLSCAFKGEIFVYTAGISSRASIEVIAENVITPTPETGVEQVQAGDNT